MDDDDDDVMYKGINNIMWLKLGWEKRHIMGRGCAS